MRSEPLQTMADDEDVGTEPCVACGESIRPVEQWEHYHDRMRESDHDVICWWCYIELDHRSRIGLADVVDEIDTRGLSPEEFVEEYYAALGRYGIA